MTRSAGAQGAPSRSRTSRPSGALSGEIAVARHELAHAAGASGGRSSTTVFGGDEHQLRQTVIARRAGEELSEHENPGEATLQVPRGRVLPKAGEVSWN